MAGAARLTTEVRGAKSLYFTTGLAEATETIVFFCCRACCPVVPLVRNRLRARLLSTALSRIVLARLTFRRD